MVLNDKNIRLVLFQMGEKATGLVEMSAERYAEKVGVRLMEVL